jgi:hypothetical protein
MPSRFYAGSGPLSPINGGKRVNRIRTTGNLQPDFQN